MSAHLSINHIETVFIRLLFSEFSIKCHNEIIIVADKFMCIHVWKCDINSKGG